MYIYMYYFCTCKDVDTGVTATTGVPTIIIHVAKRMNVQSRE